MIAETDSVCRSGVLSATKGFYFLNVNISFFLIPGGFVFSFFENKNLIWQNILFYILFVSGFKCGSRTFDTKMVVVVA